MTLTPQTISLGAGALLLVAAPLAFWAAGPEFAAGLAAAGGLTLINLWLWVAVVQQAIVSTVQGVGAGGAVLLYLLKFVGFIGLVALMVSRFPPLAVLLGCSVVVTSVMAAAAVGLRSDLQVGEGHA
jgi:hypothetical protein